MFAYIYLYILKKYIDLYEVEIYYMILLYNRKCVLLYKIHVIKICNAYSYIMYYIVYYNNIHNLCIQLSCNIMNKCLKYPCLL